MRFVWVDDGPFHTMMRAPEDGALTLVFSNSLGTDFRIWHDVVAMLPRELGILLYDSRAHGLSVHGSGAASLDRHVDDLAALVDEAGLGSHVVCGLSVGGAIAQKYALRKPANLAAIVLSNTAAKFATQEIWNDRIAMVQSGGLDAIGDNVMERWFSPKFRADSNVMVAGMRQMLTTQSSEGYVAFCEMLRDTDLRAEIGAIDVPTLCIAGEMDLSTPPQVVKAIADTVPGAQYVLIDGVGHIPCVERPKAVAGPIEAFLRAEDLLG